MFFLKSNWNSSSRIAENLNNLASLIKKWNNDVFGFTSYRKNIIIARLEGIQKCSGNNNGRYLEKLERRLNKELEKILDQEEQIWHQKSREEWIRDGDRNTRFYHTKTMIRRSINRIMKLQNDVRHWVKEDDELISLAQSFFLNIFKEDNIDSVWHQLTFSWLELNDVKKKRLNINISDVDVKAAFFQMAALKAPGPNGFPTLFFH
ncbi:uncharacterized protein LOC133295261 [Gastrolobium bilobum]|uniref:uncharacterized protein LOC133295261 n=1 Tax=Gastrolobium bilobum TaxID=150636 RepID=UPI002AB11789|nr:uncharacterized protein LOC133295261 [Gastrolobium bilobum]